MGLDIERVLMDTRTTLEDVRDALAAVSAQSAAGEAKPLEAAAAHLEHTVSAAGPGCERVRRLLRHLHVKTMPDGATKLCRGGRPAAAYAMMKLYDLTRGMVQAQAGVSVFLEECLNSLEATQTSAKRQAPGGRLLGSA